MTYFSIINHYITLQAGQADFMPIKEFDLINYFFRNQFPYRDDVILGIGDDAALCQLPEHHQLVVSVDTFNEGIHFPQNTTPEAIGYKALAVNLSDLAAMGATPAWFTLALTHTQMEERWLSAFCKGLKHLAEMHRVALIGGDTTRGTLSITIQIMGYVAAGKALRRNGARKGDGIYVTGTLGDAGVGLTIALETLIKNEQGEDIKLKESLPIELADYFQQRLAYPSPRVELGIKLGEVASSAIDISDGLAADLGHILEESNVGATLWLERLPLSLAMQSAIEHGYFSEQQAIQWALTAGDDYELCFTVPAERELLYAQFLASQGVRKIGVINEGNRLECKYKQQPWFIEKAGFQHF